MRIDRASHASSPRVSTPGGGRGDGESLLAPGSTPAPDLPAREDRDPQSQWSCMGVGSPVTVAGPPPGSPPASPTPVVSGPANTPPRTGGGDNPPPSAATPPRPPAQPRTPAAP